MGHRYFEQPGAGLFHSTNMRVERLVLQSEPRTTASPLFTGWLPSHDRDLGTGLFRSLVAHFEFRSGLI
jgi:hypothetical protein